jgi:folate-binding protein YgfZ
MRNLPLAELHQRAGATLIEADGVQRVASYGSAEAGSLAARAGAGLIDLGHRARLVVTGPDRVAWLQGMLTNDIKGLAVGQGCLAVAVTNKGKLVADLRVFQRADAVWLELATDRAAPLLDHLNRHLIMEDCAIDDRSSESAWIGLHGPRAIEILRGLAPALPDLAEYAQAEVAIAGGSAIAIGSGEFGLPGCDLWLSPDRAAAVWEALRTAGATPMGADACEILRIEAGIPRFGAELDEDTLPLEAGLERTINYEKGCYVGQEVLARVTYRGHVNRKLAGLWLAGEAPAAPHEALTHDGKPAGEVRSSIRSPHFGRPIALAYVRRELLTDGAKLTLADGREATVTSLPFKLS